MKTRLSTRVVMMAIVALTMLTIIGVSPLKVSALSPTPQVVATTAGSDDDVADDSVNPGDATGLAATDTTASRPTASSTGCDKPKLLGIFVPWYQYLTLGRDSVTGDCTVGNFRVLPGGGHTSDFLAIGLAVVDDLLRLAGLAAVIFVIYGGVQYATSQGSPDATAKAQSAILNALIGLAIAMVAVVFVTFIGNALT